ncbi:MAG: methyltransferase [Propionibacteriales bacterium]|nr:MAG: methyltransferase [Propionibacteriales bacterium]
MANALPPAALRWLLSEADRALSLEPSPGVRNQLTTTGVDLVSIVEQPHTRRHGSESLVVADPIRLPVDPCSFDVVLSHQKFHTYPQPQLLSEVARVLRPQGTFAVSYTVRDDTVPWVKSLISLMQDIDPNAMRRDSSPDSTSHLFASKYFSNIATKQFRFWRSITENQLRTMILNNPQVAAEPEQVQHDLWDEVKYILPANRSFDLRLPYQVQCWRASVDHAELSQSIELPEQGLRIQI